MRLLRSSVESWLPRGSSLPGFPPDFRKLSMDIERWPVFDVQHGCCHAWERSCQACPLERLQCFHWSNWVCQISGSELQCKRTCKLLLSALVPVPLRITCWDAIVFDLSLLLREAIQIWWSELRISQCGMAYPFVPATNFLSGSLTPPF